MICWKIRIFAYWTTPSPISIRLGTLLWFAEKFVSLLIEQHHGSSSTSIPSSCDLLKNSYLCLLNNTGLYSIVCGSSLWFAEKFVSLLIEQHRVSVVQLEIVRCDLLKNSYLCLLNNTFFVKLHEVKTVVICWKIRIFAYWTTPGLPFCIGIMLLWFAEKFVSLLIEQHPCANINNGIIVVICWKIRIFAYWTTPLYRSKFKRNALWFAEKFVSLLIEQHLFWWIW